MSSVFRACNNLTNFQNIVDLSILTYIIFWCRPIAIDADPLSWIARICVFVSSSVHPKYMSGEIGESIQHSSCQQNAIGLDATSTNYTVLGLLLTMSIL